MISDACVCVYVCVCTRLYTHYIYLQKQLFWHLSGPVRHLPSQGGLIAHDVAARQPAQVAEPDGN